MKLGLYPGCSLKGGSREYKESVSALASAFSIELHEISDWNCCGATAAHNINHELSLALPARILALAEKDGMDELVVPCAACFSRLAITMHKLSANESLRKRIAEVIEMPYTGKVKIINVIQFLEKYILPDFRFKQERTFDYKVACYYGCLLVRPHGILKFDRPEDPVSMDNIMKTLGAEPVDWAFKTECCGAGLTMSKTDVVGRLSGRLMDDAVSRGAELIVVACPMCHSNLDMRRPEINKFLGKDIRIPVIYITQAVGMAAGTDLTALGLQRHFVPVDLPYQSDIEKAKPVEQTVSEE